MGVDERDDATGDLGEGTGSGLEDEMVLPTAETVAREDFTRGAGEEEEERRPSSPMASMLVLQQGPGVESGGSAFPAPAQPAAEGGAAGWLVTFADMMTLLMCFFVLLFSFSQVDVVRFRDVARSMAAALGGAPLASFADVEGGQVLAEKAVASRQAQSSEYYAELLRRELRDEVEKNVLAVDAAVGIITIRILQNGSFESGSADLSPQFLPTARKIRDALVGIPGALTVAGHTDDTPIRTARFRSNWELAGARAFSVMYALLEGGVLPDERFVLMGFAHTRPMLQNDSEAHRAQNRRVEIVIDQRDLTEQERPGSVDMLGQGLTDEVAGGHLQVEYR
ncbi:MAG: OmpA family protein [Desulfobulbaceae bacterium]|nr:OmpA family protein [Desulfobulbaceae bacterium]